MVVDARKPASKPATTAKLFMHGRSQAVRLPKEFRFPGTEVRVSKLGNKVILEPLDMPPFDAVAWWAKLSSYKDIPFPDLPDDSPIEADNTIAFD